MFKIKKIKGIHLKYMFFLLLLVIAFGFLNGLLNFNKTTGNIGLFYYPIHQFTKDSILEFKQFPHWVPYYYGGTPFFASYQNSVFSVPILVTLLTPSIEFSVTLIVLINLFLSGVFMYFLMAEFNLKPKFAFVGAITFMFNFFLAKVSVREGPSEWWNVYLWAPLILLFCARALKSKNYKGLIKSSVLAGFFLAVSFHSGNHQMWLFVMLLVGCFFLFRLAVDINSYKRIILGGLIVLIILLGLTAIKLMPMLEFGEDSSLSGGRSFDDARGGYLEIRNLGELSRVFTNLIRREYNYPHSFDVYAVGIAALILSLFSLFKWKNRNVMFFWIMAFVVYLIAANKWVFYLFWKFVPGFNRQHHIGRVVYLLPIIFAALAGYGSNIVIHFVKKTRFKRYEKLVYVFVVLVLLFGVGFFNRLPDYNEISIKEELQSNSLYQNLSNSPGLFRVHNINTDMVGWPAVIYSIGLKVPIVHGAVNVWIPEYLGIYLSALQQAPLKLYGLLNTKYLYSNTELNISGLRFVGEFEKCDICTGADTGRAEDGPYLYENGLYLPRAYSVDNSILVVGEKNAVVKAAYSLMLNANFDPSNTVLIMGEDKKINDYEQGFLNKFDSIVLVTGSVDAVSNFKLEKYVDSGGILAPNILEGMNSISNEEINGLLSYFKGDYSSVKEIEISEYTPNMLMLDLRGSEGFVVLSEKFFMFEGWKSQIDGGSVEVLRANAMNSAIYSAGGKEAVFEYKPASFRKGMIISLITLLLVIVVLGATTFNIRPKHILQTFK